MQKQLYLVSLLLASVLMAQTYVPPGDGTLSQAIANASDGDILELVPEAVYTESQMYYFGQIVDKGITIQTEDNNPLKAVLQILTPPDGITSSRFFDVGNNASLTLHHLEMDGRWGGIATVNYGVSFYLGEVPAFTTVNKLRIEHCHFHDLLDYTLSASNSSMRGNLLVDSTFVDDVIFENVETSLYYKYCGANYISFTNSTINTTSSYGFRVSGPGETNMPLNTPTCVIDRTTWYNIGTGISPGTTGGDDPREVIQVEKGPHLGEWTVTNSIFAKQISKDRTVINIKNTVIPAEIHYICLWDVGKRTWSGTNNNNNVSDTINVDPLFADPDNGDFTLPVGSPLLTFGTGGSPIGDPRWATNTAIDEKQTNLLPGKFSLEQNYPNPFNPTTTIAFTLDKSGLTHLIVYDLMGHPVAELVNAYATAGPHTVKLDAGDLPSGIYVYRLQMTGKTITKKMILMQ